MIPVTQDRVGKEGNCFAACIASLLELPLHSIPSVGHLEDWLVRINWWLSRRMGLGVVCLAWDAEFVLKHWANALMIVSGPAARGFGHSTIYCGTDLVWDPHPSRAGLISIDDFCFITIVDAVRYHAMRPIARGAK